LDGPDRGALRTDRGAARGTILLNIVMLNDESQGGTECVRALWAVLVAIGSGIELLQMLEAAANGSSTSAAAAGEQFQAIAKTATPFTTVASDNHCNT
jgi:hypothetical protein